MGYNLKPGMVEANEDFLHKIAHVATSGEPLRLEVPAKRISSVQYQIHQLLKAAQLFKDEAEGKYTDLRDFVTVSVEAADTVIIKKSGKVEGFNFGEVRKDSELEALASLQDYRGEMKILEFKPSKSFDEEKFAAQLDRVGWIFYPQTRTEEEDGVLQYAVERKPLEGGAFDFIE